MPHPSEMTFAADTPDVAGMAEAATSAERAGLRYVCDDRPGITRRRFGKAFGYRWPDGRRVSDAANLDRIRKLAIPPAWTSVWISPDPQGHLQATGRDARGRKQHRYHPDWIAVRDELKFNRMIAFGRTLPEIRARVDADLRGRPRSRRTVLAAVVRLLETTLVRVGNAEYAQHNDSYGLTTLRDEHVELHGSELRLEFRGKSGRIHSVRLHDRRVARVIRAMQDLPGQELFQYIDEDGTWRDVDSADVNDYLREIAGESFTAKDFRTWAGTLLALLGAAGVRERRQRGRRQEEHHPGDQDGRPTARQYARRLPQELYPSGRSRRIPRRQPARDLARESSRTAA